ncbi:hypothetical protein K7432_017166 [Basidiobolus ranarum]|uniref:Uncharacterized protein n=1 Tax=Basidiobolus ranarum TaxID=34480 RepID=A0ABR2WDS0_9FUNG
MFPFPEGGCYIALFKHLTTSFQKKKSSMNPLLRKQLLDLTDIVFLGGESSTLNPTSTSTKKYQASSDLNYSDDLERVRIKLKEVLFDDAITIGFVGDANGLQFDTLKFTLTPKVARN